MERRALYIVQERNGDDPRAYRRTSHRVHRTRPQRRTSSESDFRSPIRTIYARWGGTGVRCTMYAGTLLGHRRPGLVRSTPSADLAARLNVECSLGPIPDP